jgi:HAD superfamily hydrolase (TIGR01549 family)
MLVAMHIIENEIKGKVQLMPGVEEFFRNKIPGLKYILFTEDYPNQMKIKFEKFGYDKKFDLIIGHEDTGKMKPDISFYKIAWEKFGLDPKECLYIGDDFEKDCRIGKENGGKTIIFGKDDPRADFKMNDFAELQGILKIIGV